MSDRERWRRGDRGRRDPELDWRRLAEERGVPLDDARALYEEAEWRAEYPASPSAEVMYRQWLDRYTPPRWQPAPGRRTQTMRAQAAAAGVRPRDARPEPGKRTLASFLAPRDEAPDEARPALRPAAGERLARAFELRLDDVIVHPDSAEVAAGQGAFTRDGEIHLEAGALDGDAAHGERVLAHELAHVVQQRAPSRGIVVEDRSHEGAPGERPAPTVDELEHEADQAALSALAGRAAAVRLAAPTSAALGFSKGRGIPTTPLAAAGASRPRATGDATQPSHAPPPAARHAGDGLLMKPAPESLTPGAQHRLGAVDARNQAAGTRTTELPSGEQSTDKARAAVVEPTVEQDAHAQHDVVTEVDKRPPPSPEIEAACTRIRDVIKAKRPPDEDKLVEAKPRDMAADAGHEMDQGVETRTDSVRQDYQDVQQSPKGEPSRDPVPVDLPPSKVATPAVDAGHGAPDELKHDDVSLDDDVHAQEKKLDDAGMNTEPAKLVQDGPIGDARGGVDELKNTAKTDPQKVLADQSKAIARAQGDMRALQASADKALADARAGTVQNVASHSTQIKGSEEQQRAQAGQQMQAIFTRTQRAVDGLLQPLSRTALAKWTAGVDRLSSEFEGRLAHVKAKIEERHKGDGSLLGDLGAGLTELGDSVFGLPPWVTVEYDIAEKNFGDGCTDLLRDISRDVNDVIEKCHQLIKQARQDIDKLVESLPKNLQDWAKGEAARLGKELDNLDKKVDDTQRNINKDLISRANGAVQDVRQRIHELREAAKGIIGKIADALGAFLANPFKAIVDGLLRLLGISPGAFWALVGQLGDVVSAIAKEPVRFANTLISGSGQGFQRFFDHFPQHLKEGVFSWLFGALGADGVQVPSDFSGPSIMGMVLGLVGIDGGLVSSMLSEGLEADELAEAKQEASAALAGGPLGLVHLLAEHFDPNSIVPMIREAAISFLLTAIIKQAAIRIIALFNPAGAILQAIELLFKTLIWVVQNAARIFTLIQTLVGAAGMMAAGNVGGVAAAVESALAQTIPLVLDFLASMIGVGGLGKKIREVLTKLGGKLKGSLKKVIDAISKRAKAKAKSKRDQHKGDHKDGKPADRAGHDDQKAKHDEEHEREKKRRDEDDRDPDKKKRDDDERDPDKKKHRDDDERDRDKKKHRDDDERDPKKRKHDDDEEDHKKRKHDDDDDRRRKRDRDRKHRRDHDRRRRRDHDKDGKPRDRDKDEREETLAEKEARLRKAVEEVKRITHGKRHLGILLRARLGGIKRKYKLTELTATRHGSKAETFEVHAAINPRMQFEVFSLKDHAEALREKLAAGFPAFQQETAAHRKYFGEARSEEWEMRQFAGKIERWARGCLDELRSEARSKITAQHHLIWKELQDRFVVVLKNEGDPDPSPVGAFLYEDEFKERTSAKGSPPHPVYWTERDPGTDYVKDSIGQMVPRYVVRAITVDDADNIKAGQSLVPKGGENPKGGDNDQWNHATGNEHSKFISATKQKKPDKLSPDDPDHEKDDHKDHAGLADVKNPHGKSFVDSRHRPSEAKVLIDLAHLNPVDISDASTRRGQQEWKFTARTNKPKGRQGVRDVVRTSEVIIRGKIPFDAIVGYWNSLGDEPSGV